MTPEELYREAAARRDAGIRNALELVTAVLHGDDATAARLAATTSVADTIPTMVAAASVAASLVLLVAGRDDLDPGDLWARMAPNIVAQLDRLGDQR